VRLRPFGKSSLSHFLIHFLIAGLSARNEDRMWWVAGGAETVVIAKWLLTAFVRSTKTPETARYVDQ
jgi:hypothetical protein